MTTTVYCNVLSTRINNVKCTLTILILAEILFCHLVCYIFTLGPGGGVKRSMKMKGEKSLRDLLKGEYQVNTSIPTVITILFITGVQKGKAELMKSVVNTVSLSNN